MITLRQLEFALAVAKYKHFKRAAEECNISQSALSLGIAELEKQLDTQIFERNNKQVLITPIGEEILERATRIFAEVNDLVTRAQTHQTPLAYPMTIGIIPTIAPFLLPKVLPLLRQQFPQFQLNEKNKPSDCLKKSVMARLTPPLLRCLIILTACYHLSFGQRRFWRYLLKTVNMPTYPASMLTS